MTFSASELQQLKTLIGITPSVAIEANFKDRIQWLYDYDSAHSSAFEAEIRAALVAITATETIDTDTQSLTVVGEYSVSYGAGKALSPGQIASGKLVRIKAILGYNPGTSQLIRS